MNGERMSAGLGRNRENAGMESGAVRRRGRSSNREEAGMESGASTAAFAVDMQEAGMESGARCVSTAAFV